MTTRDDYHHKFTCSQCGETIFVFGQMRDPPLPECALCRVERAWHAGFLDRREYPKAFRFHEDLHALVVGDQFDKAGIPKSLECIYLDEEGRSQREP